MGTLVSASRRTDIPAFYADWFLNRCLAGYCEGPNPRNPQQIRHLSLDPADVDCVVFWTKNPGPLLGRLGALDALGLPYLFLFTLNRYPAALEPRMPRFEDRVSTFRALAGHVGPERVVWRYDPVILSNRTPHAWHAGNFDEIARALHGATRRVIVSFLDYYRKTERRLKPLEEAGWRFERQAVDSPESHDLMRQISASARAHGIGIQTCAEVVDYTPDGAPPGSCVDGALIHELFGAEGHDTKDPHQREACGCATSCDIGVPDTCLHGCPYCYATRGHDEARARWAQHDPRAPMLWSPPRTPEASEAT